MQHTTDNQFVSTPTFDEANFVNTGWETVYSETQVDVSTWTIPGWIEFDFDQTFAYNGTDNLLVDFVVDNSIFSSYGECHAWSSSPNYRSIYDQIDEESGNLLDDNSGYVSYNIVNIVFMGINQAPPPDPPTNPAPADDATDVSLTADLSWTDGAGTYNADVYFSTTESDVTDKEASARVLNNTTNTTYDPGTMSYSTEYFWRVVAKNSAGSTTDGPVWSFTTELSAGQVQIGYGSSTDQHLPIEPNYSYTYSQSIYLATDFGSPGSNKRIEKIWYNYTWNGGNEDSDPWVIYMGTTTNTNLDAGYMDISSFTEVFNGDVDLEYVSGVGWIEIILDSPFNYDPDTDGNLVIAVDENKLSYTSPSDDFYCDEDAEANLSRYHIHDYDNPDPTSPPTGTASAYYPNTRFLFDDIPAYPAPSGLNATNIALSTADLDWTENGSATVWDIEWGLAGFTQGTGTIINDTSTKPYSLSGLDSDETYDFYVRSDDGGTSTWSNKGTFTTNDGKATNPSPADSAVDVLVTANLTWTNGFGTETVDLYFGTDNPPTTLVLDNVAAVETYDPGTMNYSTDYYWQVVCKNSCSRDQAAGPVWNFCTIGLYYYPDNSPEPGEYDNNTYDECEWTDINVSETENVSDVVIDYNWATDDWAYEGSFWLKSPSGTSVQIASEEENGTYSHTLSDFNGENMNGTWKLWIEDSYGDGGHQASGITVEFRYLIDFPAGEPIDVGDGTTVYANANLNYAADQTIPEIPNGSFTPEQEFVLAGSGTVDITITTSSMFGAYYQGGIWNTEENDGGTIFFDDIDFDARGDAPIILGDDNPLPVTLSTFNAIYNNEVLTIEWATESEENNAGWNIYRGTEEDALENDVVIQINDQLIAGAGTTNNITEYSYIDEQPIQAGETYWYWLEDISSEGETEVHSPTSLSIPIGDAPEIPLEYGLHQNYPNPFNPSTTIIFRLTPERMENTEKVEIEIFNMRGQKIRTYPVILSGTEGSASYHSIIWDGKDEKGKAVSSGVYYYKLNAGKYSETKKMLMIK